MNKRIKRKIDKRLGFKKYKDLRYASFEQKAKRIWYNAFKSEHIKKYHGLIFPPS